MNLLGTLCLSRDGGALGGVISYCSRAVLRRGGLPARAGGPLRTELPCQCEWRLGGGGVSTGLTGPPVRTPRSLGLAERHYWSLSTEGAQKGRVNSELGGLGVGGEKARLVQRRGRSSGRV